MSRSKLPKPIDDERLLRSTIACLTELLGSTPLSTSEYAQVQLHLAQCKKKYRLLFGSSAVAHRTLKQPSQNGKGPASAKESAHGKL